MTSYQAKNIRVAFGGGSFSADLTESIQGSLQVNGTGQVVRSRRLGNAGVTADMATAGLAATMQCFYDEETEKLQTNAEGVLMIGRTDAAYGYAFPAVASARPITSRASGAVGVALTFQQTGASEAISGTALFSGTPTIPNNGFLYMATTANVRKLTSAVALSGGSWAVAGLQVLAEGVS